MSSSEITTEYGISRLPDPSYTKFQASANGDVCKAINEAWEHFSRAIVSMPSGSVSVDIRMLFSPFSSEKDRQKRLKLTLISRAKDSPTGRCLASLIEKGPLNNYYGFRRLDSAGGNGASKRNQRQYNASCDIVRREDMVAPLYTKEFNPHIPSRYYTVDPFEANGNNDYATLDRILDDINEKVLIIIRAEPADCTEELLENPRYMARLESINRAWDTEEERDFLDTDYIGNGNTAYSTRHAHLKPLHYRDPLANDILRQQQDIHETLRMPNLFFNIRVMAETEPVARLAGSVMAESAFTDGKYRIVSSKRGETLFDDTITILNTSRVVLLPLWDHLWKNADTEPYRKLRRMGQLAGVDELTGVFRLPIASYFSPCCIPKNTDPPDVGANSLIVIGYDNQIGHYISGDADGIPRGLTLAQFLKHIFVCGMPGGGKTTSIINMISQLHALGIPVIVLETAKTDYRCIKAQKKSSVPEIRELAKDLEIYTCGNEKVSPLKFNSLEILEGITHDEHIDTILSCFMAAMPISGPLPAILGEALENVYKSHPDRRNPPTISDLIEAADKVLAKKGYSGETASDIRAALEVRLGLLDRRLIGRVFRCRYSEPDIEHLMKSFSLIELNRLPAEQSCLLCLFILTAIREHLKTTSSTAKGLRMVIFIEEAHNIVGRSTDAKPSEENPDPKSFASGFICRMLAELRSLGVGIVVIDQLPSAVAPEVIKNTATKLAFRQVANQDREDIGGTMLFTNIEMEDIARLTSGEAFFSTEGYYGPRRIRTVNLHSKINLSREPSDDELLALISGEEWFKRGSERRIAGELHMLAGHIDNYDAFRTQVAGNVKLLLRHYSNMPDKLEGQSRRHELAVLSRKAKLLGESLTDRLNAVIAGPFSAYLDPEYVFPAASDDLNKFRNSLIERFNSVTRTGTDGITAVIDRFVQNCNKHKK